MTVIDASKFWSKVAIGEPAACWPWLGSNHKPGGGGYGRFHLGNDKFQYSHRIAWELANGRPLRADMFACHTCDNPPCCNPGHLFEGSPRDNVVDMLVKGRGRHLLNKCNAGHEMTPENSIVRRNGHRLCRTCARATWREQYREAPWERCATCDREVSPRNMHNHVKTKSHIIKAAAQAGEQP